MKRKIIQIDEAECTGCGECIDICAEAALEMVDNKAKVVKDFYCDGMGACLDVCPVDALKIVEKEVAEYDPAKTYEHVKKQRGEEEAQKVHGIEEINKDEDPSATLRTGEDKMKCGCPGTMMKDFRDKNEGDIQEKVNIKSALRQWPIQLHLIMPQAPYFENADLLISADCVPFALANFHTDFLQGKTLIMFCPKLDQEQEVYLEKLTEIFKTQNIKSITTLRMEVPCCGGVKHLAEEAMKKSGKDISIKDVVVSVGGEVV